MKIEMKSQFAKTHKQCLESQDMASVSINLLHQFRGKAMISNITKAQHQLLSTKNQSVTAFVNFSSENTQFERQVNLV
jgi:hypothetical protein